MFGMVSVHMSKNPRTVYTMGQPSILMTLVASKFLVTDAQNFEAIPPVAQPVSLRH